MVRRGVEKKEVRSSVLSFAMWKKNCLRCLGQFFWAHEALRTSNLFELKTAFQVWLCSRYASAQQFLSSMISGLAKPCGTQTAMSCASLFAVIHPDIFAAKSLWTAFFFASSYLCKTCRSESRKQVVHELPVLCYSDAFSKESRDAIVQLLLLQRWGQAQLVLTSLAGSMAEETLICRVYSSMNVWHLRKIFNH